MKNLTTLLLLTTSITSISAMDMGAPAGVAGGAASGAATNVVHAEPAAPAPAFISNDQNMVLTPDTMGVFRTIAGYLGTKDLLNFSMAQRNHTIPCLKIIKSRLEGMGLPVDLIEGVPPQMPLVPHLAISDLRILESIDGIDNNTRFILLKHYGNKFPAVQEAIAHQLAIGMRGFTQAPTLLRRLADAGWVKAQRHVAEGLTRGEYGFEQNSVELRRLADAGWVQAQWCVAEGLAEGKYGFEQNPAELRRLADAGWVEAQRYVAEGLAKGKYGITPSPDELRNLANLPSPYNWKRARHYVAWGLAGGEYGFDQNLEELSYLAHDAGWVQAQSIVTLGLMHGGFGYEQDPAELRRLADMGRKDAQRYVAIGLEKGCFGIPQDHAELRRLAVKHARDPYSDYVERYLYALHSQRDYFQFFIDADRAG